jgi:hypothetical protein
MMYRRGAAPAITLLGLSFAFGCSDSETATSSADLPAMCEALCKYDTRCAESGVTPTPAEECKANCLRKAGTNNVYRADALGALRDCYGTLACTDNDDACFESAVYAVTRDPTSDAVFQACRARHTECGSDGTGDFSDDHCASQLIFIAQAKASFDSCLKLPCEQINACWEQVIGTSG